MFNIPSFGNKRILIFENDTRFLQFLELGLTEAGLRVDFSDTIDSFANQVQNKKHDFTLISSNFGLDSILKITNELPEDESHVRFYLLINFSEVNKVYGSDYKMFDDFLVKPVTINQVIRVLRKSLIEQYLLREITNYKEIGSTLRGENNKLRGFIESRFPGDIDSLLNSPETKNAGAQKGIINSYAKHQDTGTNLSRKQE